MKRRSVLLWSFAGLLLMSMIASVLFGAVSLTASDFWAAFQKSTGPRTLHENIILELRLPRTFLGVLCGAALGVGGVLLQALFRNPIVEPGIIGTSSGAAFGAALYFVFGASLPAFLDGMALTLMSLAGSLVATLLLLAFDDRSGGKELQILLAGIAVHALFMSGVGFMSYLARDPQARSITFWNLGTLSGANWRQIYIGTALILPTLYAAVRMGPTLNAITLGWEEAAALGVKVRAFRWIVIGLQILLVATVTSMTGVIPFVGLIVPHLLRLLGGGEHRFLLLGSILLGPVVVLLTDILARLALAPAEVPLGILTSFVGAPVFLLLLKKSMKTITL